MRRLVVCADGTWNRPDEEDHGIDTATNVVKIARAVRPVARDGTSQITYYDTGVGTHNVLDKFVGGAFGEGLDDKILDGYRFLVHNYEPGDEVFLFGFSRGAYTVRSLAGLLRNSGLLRPEHATRMPEAFALYRDRDPKSHPTKGEEATAFRAKYAQEIPIKCIGVWDTVGALGIPVGLLLKKFSHQKHEFHDVTLSSKVENAFHALALDERRKPFQPTLWRQPLDDLGTTWLEQAWFAGVHSNIGGGYPDARPSDITLQWMVERVRDRCGLDFNDDYLQGVIDTASLGELADSMSRVYRSIGEVERQIDDAAQRNIDDGFNTWEYVHSSVQKRCEATATQGKAYAPSNFDRYRQRTAPAGPWIWDRIGAAEVELVRALFAARTAVGSGTQDPRR